MNILFMRYNCISEPGVLEAFQRLGVDVIEDFSYLSGKESSQDEKIYRMVETITLQKPMFVFSINFFPLVSKVCERLGVLYVALSVDCPVLELYSVEIRNKCNRVFLFDYMQYLSVKDENPEGIFYLPLGGTAEAYDRLMGSYTGQKDFLYDVSFIGSLYSEKSPYESLPLSDYTRGWCDGLMDIQLQVPGMEILREGITENIIREFKKAGAQYMDFPGMISDMNAFVVLNEQLGYAITARERQMYLNALGEACDLHLFTGSDTGALKGVKVHGRVSSLKEMPQVFRQSRINLNINMRPIQTGLPQRIWDVLASGGFMLTSYEEELPEYFEIGKHLDAFENAAEAKEKVRYYLAHEEKRMEMTMAGYELVKEKHTVLHRVMQIIRTISS